MNEISQILGSKEKIIWDGKPKYVPYIISAIFVGIFIGGICGLVAGIFSESIIVGLIAGIIIFSLLFLWSNISYKFMHYALTNRRVVLQNGVFGRNFKSINYDEIKNASVARGLFNFIFGTGSINIFTGEMELTGGEHSRMKPKYDSFVYISNAYDVLKKLQEHLTEMEENMYGGKNVVQRVKIIKRGFK